MLTVLELFCGIGGCAAALAGRARVTAAVDVSPQALRVYRENFPDHPAAARLLETVGAADLARWRADLWWLSPPCQPFTRRGLGRDDFDPRSRALLALIPRLAEERPPFFALENVPGFAASRTHGRLAAALDRAGYRRWEGEICPSELGVPNRRRRWFLVAARDGDPAPPAPRPCRSRLGDHLDPALDRRPDPELAVPGELLASYRGALDLVAAGDPDAVTACFTAAYGRSPVRSGSYLVPESSPVRRFSPAEVLRLLGFPPGFALPAGTPHRLGWRLAGNSLSLPAVRAALAGLPGLGPAP